MILLKRFVQLVNVWMVTTLYQIDVVEMMSILLTMDASIKKPYLIYVIITTRLLMNAKVVTLGILLLMDIAVSTGVSMIN
jgi:hypothetical protein